MWVPAPTLHPMTDEATTRGQTTTRGPVPSGGQPATGGQQTERTPARPGLSPSRASDFQQCPLLFRFRVVDRLPEPPSPAAARGTLVHAALERLYDLPAPTRTPEAAETLLAPAWARLRDADPALGDLHDGDGGLPGWLAEAARLVTRYFTLEDPTRLQPAEREVWLRTQLPDGPELRGIVDRLDVAPDGAIRVVDYKTGKSPREGYESGALFQMRFYAYLVRAERGVLPRMLQLVYLGDGRLVRHEPTEAEMTTLDLRVRTVWQHVQAAAESGRWEPRRSRLCDWCSFRAYCPAFEGTPPEVDPAAVERATGVIPAA